MKRRLKNFIFRLLGKDPEAVVVTFAAGDAQLAARMVEEVRRLVPDRRHFVISSESGSAWSIFLRLRRRFRGYRIGLAPVLFDGKPSGTSLRRAAFLFAPGKLLVFNSRLERHHVRLRTWIASVLFLRGVPLDRIWLRPVWLVPWKKDRSTYPPQMEEYEGRPFSQGRKRIAIVTPYFPFPLSHGGAVRIFYLLREISKEFDVVLLAFVEDAEAPPDLEPVREHCARIVLVQKPRYREPRWSTLDPPEVCEYRSPAMRRALDRVRSEYAIDALQVEYTALAPYAGDVLVEHDVTYSLYGQIRDRDRKLVARWNFWRWHRFEHTWIRRYHRVVVMSEQDRGLLNSSNIRVVPNGVDLSRFRPEIERPGDRLLFIGSFRHFPNIVAFRFFVDEVWPRLRTRLEDVRVTVVAGPDPTLYWREYTGRTEIPAAERIELLGYVSDVRPLYIEASLVLVPTLVSAGTNLKVLEALAMERAVVSTSSGCGGLGLEHGVNVWIADSAEEFAAGILNLSHDDELRRSIAAAGRRHAEQHFDWREIGAKQRALLREVCGGTPDFRQASAADMARILEIQVAARESSQWAQEDYLTYDCRVAVIYGTVVGFLVSRRLDDQEREILNVAVDPAVRRSGIATELIRTELRERPGTYFLEVRQSNGPARQLYRMLGFEEIGTRPDYYDDPREPAIVMRIHS